MSDVNTRAYFGILAKEDEDNINTKVRTFITQFYGSNFIPAHTSNEVRDKAIIFRDSLLKDKANLILRNFKTRKERP